MCRIPLSVISKHDDSRHNQQRVIFEQSAQAVWYAHSGEQVLRFLEEDRAD